MRKRFCRLAGMLFHAVSGKVGRAVAAAIVAAAVHGAARGQELPQCVHELIANDPPAACYYHFGAGNHLSTAICGTGPLSPTHGVGYSFYISLGGFQGIVQSVEVEGVPATVTLDAIEPGSIVIINFEGYGHARILVHGENCTFTHELDVVDSVEDPLNCGPRVQLCDHPGPIPFPNEEPYLPTVCPGSVLCLRAAGWCHNWHYWIVDGNAVILGPGDEETVWVQFTQPGYASVTTDGSSLGAYFEVLDWSLAVDLDIDSDNNNGLSVPGRTTAEENIEDDATKPGKVVFVSGDEDGDGVPDFADGIGELNNGNGGSVAHFTPIRLQLPTDDITHTSFWFDYNASDPAGVHIDYDYPPDWGTQWKPADLGRLRLWTTDAGDVRSFQAFPTGGYVAPNVAYDLADFQSKGLINHGVITLWVEAVKASPQRGAEEIQVVVEKTSTTGDCVASGHDEVRVTAAEIDVRDLRAWGPQMNENGAAAIHNNDLSANPPDSIVGGAITDGASICLVRVMPNDLPWNTFGPCSVSIERPDLAPWQVAEPAFLATSDPKLVGTMHSVAAGTPVVLPTLPTPWPIPSGTTSSASFLGKAFYVPPETYANALWAGFDDPAGHTLPASASPIETLVTIEMTMNGTIVGKRPFLLRRPPLVLTHGIISGPETWDTQYWYESESYTAGVQTRLYKVDYGSTSHQGYDANFGFVAKMIEGALREYRTGNDALVPGVPAHASTVSLHGVHYAATRADVIGHSMGGQLARWYAANFATEHLDIARGGQWPTLQIARHAPPADIFVAGEDGHWPYLRDDNYGAGSIRRLITMGSPFRGSPAATLPKGLFEPSPQKKETLQQWALTGGMPDTLKNLLWQPDASVTANYSPPTCVNDLDQDSVAQYVLTDRVTEIPGDELWAFTTSYPPNERQVRWFAFGGKSTPLTGSSSLTWIHTGILTIMAAAAQVQGGQTIVHYLSYADYVVATAAVAANNSDLVVPLDSQYNSMPPAANTHEFSYHTHSAPLPGNNETTSPFMQREAVKLLSVFLDGITLTGQSGDGQTVSVTVTNCTFLPLTTAP